MFSWKPSPDDTVDFVILQCDMSQRVLWRHGGQEVDVTEEVEFVLGAHSKKRDFAMQEEDDSEGIAPFAEKLVHIDVIVGFFYFFFVLRIAGYLRSTIFRFMSVFEPTGTLIGSGDIVVRATIICLHWRLGRVNCGNPRKQGKRQQDCTEKRFDFIEDWTSVSNMVIFHSYVNVYQRVIQLYIGQFRHSAVNDPFAELV